MEAIHTLLDHSKFQKKQAEDDKSNRYNTLFALNTNNKTDISQFLDNSQMELNGGVSTNKKAADITHLYDEEVKHEDVEQQEVVFSKQKRKVIAPREQAQIKPSRFKQESSKKDMIIDSNRTNEKPDTFRKSKLIQNVGSELLKNVKQKKAKIEADEQ